MIPAVSTVAASASSIQYRWVAVGASGNLATSDSTTASSWTARTSSFSTTGINDVASNEAGLFVAVGDAGKLATSSDGVTWTQQTSSFSTTNIVSISYGAGYWVAGGESGKLATSTDGITWTQRTTGFSASYGVYATYGNGYWVGTNQNGGIRTATDPTGTWTNRSPALTQSFLKPRYSPFASIWNTGCDTNTNNAVQSASDPTSTWTVRSLPSSTGVLPIAHWISNASVIAVLYSKGVGLYDIASSTNGTTFTDRTPAITTTGGRPGKDDTGFMVFPGEANTLQTSSDGTTWTSRTGPTFAQTAICNSRAIT